MTDVQIDIFTIEPITEFPSKGKIQKQSISTKKREIDGVTKVMVSVIQEIYNKERMELLTIKVSYLYTILPKDVKYFDDPKSETCILFCTKLAQIAIDATQEHLDNEAKDTTFEGEIILKKSDDELFEYMKSIVIN